jgi:surfactin synthase thioesterase subunit
MVRLSSRRDDRPWPAFGASLGGTGRTESTRLTTEVHVETLMVMAVSVHEHDHATIIY